MIQAIIDGIIKTIKDKFGNDYECYAVEKIEQGLQEPCFFIMSLPTSQTPYPSNRTLRQYSFDIQYFPKNRNSNKEMREIGESLMALFGVLELLDGIKIRGTNIHHEIQGDVLHFFVDYNVFATVTVEQEEMEGFEMSTTIAN